MDIYSKNDSYTLYSGSMLDMNEVIADNSIDSIVTDPPYELNFMNKGWDNTGIAFQKETWEHCLKVLKPGGYLLAFGGSRTFHRIACAIEDAGFEIRDTLMWIYGSGFSKSMNLGKSVEAKLTRGNANKQAFKDLDGDKVKSGGWGISKNTFEYGARQADYSADGHLRTNKVNYKTQEGQQLSSWGTCLKPAFEPVIIARKPCEGSTTDNVLKYGVGGLNIDECRIGTETIKTNAGNKFPNVYGAYKECKESEHEGRFPANVILTYDETDEQEVCGGFPCGGQNGSISKRYKMNNTVYGEYGECNTWKAYEDSGSAARYFYCAKASRRDRDEGLACFEDSLIAGSNQAKAELNRGNSDFAVENAATWNSIKSRKNPHPTIKPTDLMSYLVRLVTPNGGIVLDPFNGSGSTGKAVMWENRDHNKGYKYIGIELTPDYLPISKARIEYAMTAHIEEENEDQMQGQMSIYDFI